MLRNLLTASAIICTALPGPALAGGHHYAGPVCNDVTCVPRRLTYGYTPTSWRRWPGAVPAGAAQPAPEELPTPATEKGETPAEPAEPREPALTPEEAPLVPTERAPSGRAPSERSAPAITPESEAPLMPPFDDVPPSPPQRSTETAKPPASSDEMPEFSPSQPPEVVPSETKSRATDSDPPPPMPDDNPFKDDPPSMPDTQKKTSHTSEPDGAVAATSTQAAAKWHVSVKGADDDRSALRPLGDELEGPALLPATSDDEASQPTIESATRRNPLRVLNTTKGFARAVPVANWTRDEPASSSGRRNPLRGN
ncbi:MAG TPA: hypothetical protein VL175_22200 [Pirellulales bacterium]|jgi:hypothetical protein|nr:hypothetical protein [Pirellulales bacterium]